jgi:hypothetical protein
MNLFLIFSVPFLVLIRFVLNYTRKNYAVALALPHARAQQNVLRCIVNLIVQGFTLCLACEPVCCSLVS